MSGRYILDVNKNPIEVSDLTEWASWMDNADRTVIRTTREGLLISTVFLGSDHGYYSETPIVFETMVFQNEKSGNEIYCDRYSTYEEAKVGHLKACQKYLNDYSEDDIFIDML